MSTERLVEDLCIIGTPKMVAEKLISYQEDVTGADPGHEGAKRLLLDGTMDWSD